MVQDPQPSRPSPLTIEQEFRSLLVRLAYPLSARRHLMEIERFLANIVPECVLYESYTLEIVQRVPDIVDRLNVVGIDPATLRPLYEQLKELIIRLPSISNLDNLGRCMQRLRTALATLYHFVGEQGEGSEFDIQPSGQRELISLPPASETTLIPVVERSLVEMRGAFKESGYLRRITVHITGTTKGHDDLFQTQVMVLGEQGRLSNELIAAASAARSVVLQKEMGVRNKHFTGFVTFDELNAFHQGSSANLAIATLIATAMFKYVGTREQYQLTGETTVTGDVSELGEILPVDTDSLRLKTEAVFFSNIRYFVVPKSQLSIVEDVVRTLNERYPNRKLTCMGLGHLVEIFYDRRLTQFSQIGIPRLVVNKASQNKLPVAASIFVILFLVFLSRMLAPRTSDNPVSATFAGNKMLVQNEEGRVLEEINVGPVTVERAKTGDSYDASRVVKFYDVDGDGKNEMIYVRAASRDTGGMDVLACRSLWRKIPKWETPFQRAMSFPKNPVDSTEYFSIANFIVGNFERGSPPEVFVCTGHTFFPSVLFKLNAQDGRAEASYVHTGHLTMVSAANTPGDSVQEIVLAGVNNAYNATALVVLDPRLVAGHSPCRGTYEPEGIPVGTEKYYILIPRTITSTSEQNEFVHNYPQWIDVERSKKLVQLTVADLEVNMPGSGVRLVGSLVYTFDSSMNIQNINSGTPWDQAAGILLREHKVRSIPDGSYLNNAYKRTLLYWDGEHWQNKPTINKRYLDALAALRQSSAPTGTPH